MLLLQHEIKGKAGRWISIQSTGWGIFFWIMHLQRLSLEVKYKQDFCQVSDQNSHVCEFYPTSLKQRMLSEALFCLHYAAYLRKLLLWKAHQNWYHQSLALKIDCLAINYFQAIFVTVHDTKYNLCMRYHSRSMSKCLNLLHLKTEICVDTLKVSNVMAGITKRAFCQVLVHHY